MSILISNSKLIDKNQININADIIDSSAFVESIFVNFDDTQYEPKKNDDKNSSVPNKSTLIEERKAKKHKPNQGDNEHHPVLDATDIPSINRSEPVIETKQKTSQIKNKPQIDKSQNEVPEEEEYLNKLLILIPKEKSLPEIDANLERDFDETRNIAMKVLEKLRRLKNDLEVKNKQKEENTTNLMSELEMDAKMAKELELKLKIVEQQSLTLEHEAIENNFFEVVTNDEEAVKNKLLLAEKSLFSLTI